jgi:hypothetical protein
MARSDNSSSDRSCHPEGNSANDMLVRRSRMPSPGISLEFVEKRLTISPSLILVAVA